MDQKNHGRGAISFSLEKRERGKKKKKRGGFAKRALEGGNGVF